MGQTRRDTGPQRAAKRKGSEDRRCPACGRGNAVRTGHDNYDDVDARVYVTVRECRWRDQSLCDFKQVTEDRVPAN